MDHPHRTIPGPEGASILAFEDQGAACLAAADLVAGVIRQALADRGKAVLGLATGSTPEPIYARLVELHRTTGLSFAGVATYNLDEYYPISPVDPRSYRAYMHRHLFEHVDLKPNHAHVLDGTVPIFSVPGHASAFDRWIEIDGGLDFQLLGIGRNGHIGFNEPSDTLTAEEAIHLPTRLVELHPTTVRDAAKDFGREGLVPRLALTMGIAPILAARSILVVALGPHKAEAVARSIRGEVTPLVPASLLRLAAGPVTWILDEAAAAQL